MRDVDTHMHMHMPDMSLFGSIFSIYPDEQAVGGGTKGGVKILLRA